MFFEFSVPVVTCFLHNLVWTFESFDYRYAAEMKAAEQFFPVVLLIMLHKVVLTFEFVDDIFKCDHSNERY